MASPAPHAPYSHLASLNDSASSPSDDNTMLVDSDADDSPAPLHVNTTSNNNNNGHAHPVHTHPSSTSMPRHVHQTSTESDLDGDADADGDRDADADAEADPDFDDAEDAGSYVAPGGTNSTSVRSIILSSAYFGGPNMFLSLSSLT